MARQYLSHFTPLIAPYSGCPVVYPRENECRACRRMLCHDDGGHLCLDCWTAETERHDAVVEVGGTSLSEQQESAMIPRGGPLPGHMVPIALRTDVRRRRYKHE